MEKISTDKNKQTCAITDRVIIDLTPKKQKGSNISEIDDNWIEEQIAKYEAQREIEEERAMDELVARAEDMIREQEKREQAEFERLVQEAETHFELEEQAKLDNMVELAEEPEEKQESETYESAARPATGVPYITEGDGIALEEDEGLPEEEEQNNFEDLYMEDQASRFYTEEDVNALPIEEEYEDF